MYRLSDTTSSPCTFDDSRKTPAVRSYRQIAQILADRNGIATTQALVGRICRAAERKLACALLADPLIRERLRPSAALGHGRAALSWVGR